MRCLYCGKPLPLLKKLTGGGEFCSDAHRHKYQEEYNKLALSRLLQAQTPAQAQASVANGGITPRALRQLPAPAPRGNQRALPAPTPAPETTLAPRGGFSPRPPLPEPPPVQPGPRQQATFDPRHAPFEPKMTSTARMSPRQTAPPPPPIPPQPDPPFALFHMDRYDPLSTDVKFRIKGTISVQPEFTKPAPIEKPAASGAEGIPFDWDELADVLTRATAAKDVIAAVAEVAEVPVAVPPAPAPIEVVAESQPVLEVAAITPVEPVEEPKVPVELAAELAPVPVETAPAVEPTAIEAPPELSAEEEKLANMAEPPEAGAWDPPIDFRTPPEAPKPATELAIPFGGLVLYPVSGPVALSTRYPRPVREKILSPAPPIRITLVSGATVQPGFSNSAAKHLHGQNGRANGAATGRYAGVVPQWRPSLSCVNAPVRTLPVAVFTDQPAGIPPLFENAVDGALPMAASSFANSLTSLEDTLVHASQMTEQPFEAAASAIQPAPPPHSEPDPHTEQKFEVVINLAALGIFDD